MGFATRRVFDRYLGPFVDGVAACFFLDALGPSLQKILKLLMVSVMLGIQIMSYPTSGMDQPTQPHHGPLTH